MTVLIRKATEDDLVQIALLAEEIFSYPPDIQQLQLEAKDGFHLLFAALNENGELLGFASLMHVLDEGTLTYIAVTRHSRRLGIGDALLKALDRAAEELSLSFITLEVRPSNGPALALYRQNGYEHAGMIKNYYQRPQEDALVLTKLFQAPA